MCIHFNYRYIIFSKKKCIFPIITGTEEMSITTFCKDDHHEKGHKSSCEKVHRCIYCRYSTHNSSHMKMHLSVHTGEKPYECPVCKKTFRLKHYLEYHLNTHPGEKPFRCDKCAKSFIKMTFLKKHKLSHH